MSHQSADDQYTPGQVKQSPGKPDQTYNFEQFESFIPKLLYHMYFGPFYHAMVQSLPLPYWR